MSSRHPGTAGVPLEAAAEPLNELRQDLLAGALAEQRLGHRPPQPQVQRVREVGRALGADRVSGLLGEVAGQLHLLLGPAAGAVGDQAEEPDEAAAAAQRHPDAAADPEPANRCAVAQPLVTARVGDDQRLDRLGQLRAEEVEHRGLAQRRRVQREAELADHERLLARPRGDDEGGDAERSPGDRGQRVEPLRSLTGRERRRIDAAGRFTPDLPDFLHYSVIGSTRTRFSSTSVQRPATVAAGGAV